MASTENPANESSSKPQPYRNVLILSINYQIVFTAYLALQNLQSSINQEEGLGTVALSILYACIIVSGTLAPVCIAKIGAKWSMVFGWIAHCLYTAANFYPRWLTLVPASVLLGCISGPLWTSQSVYLSHQAFAYADATGLKLAAVLTKFNGIYFTIFETTQIAGNLISSLVLKPGETNSEADNVTSNNVSLTCGALDCPVASNATTIEEPEQAVIYTLLGAFLALDVIGLCITFFFLPKLNRKSTEKPPFVLKSALSCGKLLGDSRMVLLVPLIMFMAMEQAVLWSEFTKSYISCPLGVGMIGYIMAAYGGSTTIFAFVFSRIAEFTGRYVMFGIAGSVNMAIWIAMLFWQPSAEALAFHFVIVAAWGMADGIWQTQVNALIALVFQYDTGPAFANYHTWRAVGFTVTFAYSSLLCVSTKLYVAIGLLAVAMTLYIVLEVKLNYRSTVGVSYDVSAPDDNKSATSQSPKSFDTQQDSSSKE